MEHLFKKVLQEITAYQSNPDNLGVDGGGGKINPLDIKRKIGKGKSNAYSKTMEQKQLEMKEKALGKLGVHNLDELVENFSDQEWHEFLTHYHLIDVIGSGGFGVVLSAHDVKNNRKVALKVCLKESVKGDMLQKEFEILKQMDHPNVVSIYDMLNYENYLIYSMSIGYESVSDLISRRKSEGDNLSD